MRLVFTMFRTFSENPCFNVVEVGNIHRVNKNLELDKVRVDFLKCCINNAIQFL